LAQAISFVARAFQSSCSRGLSEAEFTMGAVSGVQCCWYSSANALNDFDLITSEELADKLASQTFPVEEKPGEVAEMIDLAHVASLAFAGSGEDENNEVSDIAEDAPRKQGFVTKKQVMFMDVSSATEDALPEAGSRVRTRKTTGYVTKETLVKLLGDLSDEEEDMAEKADKANQDAIVVAAKTKVEKKGASSPRAIHQRCKARKGTGFVTKAKLRKVLDVVGEDEV